MSLAAWVLFALFLVLIGSVCWVLWKDEEWWRTELDEEGEYDLDDDWDVGVDEYGYWVLQMKERGDG